MRNQGALLAERLKVFEDTSTLAARVADRICALVREREQQGRAINLGLAAGSSPQGVYRELVARVKAGSLDLSRSQTFCLDEYFPISPADRNSYALQLSHVATALGVASHAFHVPSGALSREQLEQHCRDYEATIRSAGGIDFQLLGLGNSGHIGFNEPGSSRTSRTRLVRLDARTRQDAAAAFERPDEVPREGVTMGVGTILEAREIVLIVHGSHKAQVVERFVDGPVSEDIPATFLRSHANMSVYLDVDAARLLPRRVLDHASRA